MTERWRAPRGPLPSVVYVYRCPVCGFRAEWPRIKEHVMDAHPGWGGKREGSGRKPTGGQPRRPVTVWLSEVETATLRELGGGNASAGVRRLLDQTGTRVGQANGT